MSLVTRRPLEVSMDSELYSDAQFEGAYPASRNAGPAAAFA
jgi:hypothetical protein